MTLKELAGSRVTAGQLSFVELGKSNPSGELLQYIADRLGVTADYLLESEISQAQRICEYNMKLSEVYIYGGKDDEAYSLLDSTALIAKKYKLYDLIGMVELNKGKISYKKQLYQKAAEYFLKANKHFLESNNYLGAINTYIFLSQTSCNNGFHVLGLSYFMQAESLFMEKSLSDEQMVARIYFSICMCNIKLGNNEQADIYLPKVEKYLDSISNKEQYANNLMTMSLAYRDAKDYDKALYYANKALDTFKEIEDKKYIYKMLMNIGSIYYEKRDIDKSNYYLANCEKVGDSFNCDDIYNLYLQLAANHMYTNNSNQAVCFIEKSFKLAIEHKSIDCQVECYKYLYKVYISNKNYKECESVLKNMLNLLLTVDKVDELAKCYMSLVDYYNIIGDRELTAKYLQKGLEVYEKLKSQMAI